jgi:outer membrane protein assembly factor BamD (BamD/ComL family)
MELRTRPRRLYAGIMILFGVAAMPFAVGADFFNRNDSHNIANLEFRNASFELYQHRNYSSLQQLLKALELPGAVSGRSDNKAFMADYLYQKKELSEFNQLLVGGRLADAPLSKDETDVVLADLYLAVGLPRPAERLLRKVEGKRTAAPKHSWLSAAHFYYQHGYLAEAQRALAELLEIPSGELQAQRDSLSALVDLADGQDDDAIATLQASSGQGEQLALDRYNLALALLDQGDTRASATALDRLDKTSSPSADSAQLKDAAAVNLGFALLRQGKTEQAAAALHGLGGQPPYSSYALLGKGWIDFLKGDDRKALQSWLPLSKRDPSDAAVQEAILLTPYVYYRLQDYPQAMKYYEQAANDYQKELARIQAAHTPLTNGDYLRAFLTDNQGNGEFDSGWSPRTLPASPVNSYLLPTLSGHRFIAGLNNYRELLLAQGLLTTAGSDIAASLSLLARQQANSAAWQQIKRASPKQLDPNALLASVKKIQSDLAKAEVHHDIMAFATADQVRLLRNLEDANILLNRLKDYIVDNAALRRKYQLLRGLLIWDLTEQYPTRVQEVKQQLQDLENTLDKYASNSTHLTGNPAKINTSLTKREDAYKALGAKQTALLATTKGLIAEQKAYLDKLLEQGLREGESRLQDYMARADLGLAQATDRVASASPNQDYSAAIAAYQAFLDHNADSPYRRDVMFREAYLKMQQADKLESAQADASAKKADRGDALYAEAAALLQKRLKAYPDSPDNDRVLYNLAEAYDRRGNSTAMLDTLDRLAKDYPRSAYIDETQFRRGEVLFSVSLPGQAAEAYNAIVSKGPASPLYDKALYKLGWSRYKQGQYAVAVDTFIPLLGRKWPNSPQGKPVTAAKPTRGEEEMIDDILRGASLSLAQLKGVETLKDYFKRHGTRPYEYRLYQTLAQLYLEQQRIADAVNVYRSFVAQHPNDPLAPTFDSLVLNAYKKGGFINLLQKAKADFIDRYQPASDYWKNNPGADRDAVLAKVHDYLEEMTNYAHAKAQQTKSAADYQRAEDWYRLFLQSFPQDPLASKMHFLFAELLYEDHHFAEASQEYAKVAYEYKDRRNGAEAAYADVLAREKLAATLGGAERQAADQQALLALQRFTDTYPDDPRTPAALIKSAQQWLTLNQQGKAEKAAQRLLDIKPSADAALRRNAWTILANGQFERKRFSAAEHSYQQVLALMSRSDAKRRDVEENLAAAVYKQGEAARDAGDLHGAVQNFLRIKTLTPGASIVATAQYDAAAALLALHDWQKAIPLLEAFRRDYPGNPLQKDIAPKLAVAYQKTGNWRKAATELEIIAEHGEGKELQRDAVWQSAGLYLRAGQTGEAQRMYREYTRRFPHPVAQVVEAQQHLADLSAQQQNIKRQHYWLRQIIDTDKRSGSERTEHTRLLAGRATLVLADARYQYYTSIKLTNPLKKSLKRKKRAMKAALAAYRGASDYGIAAITTAATYHAAQIYSDLAKALLNSERPKGLSALELEQYKVLLEEQAYPFEEQAIALHEANARRTTEHIYNDWVKRSFAALSKLLPGRYAKTEKGDAYVDAIY